MTRPAGASVLVTGGLGFIGVHLCRALLRRDPSARLTIVDDLSSTRMDYADLEGRADIHVQDLRTFASRRGRYDVVYHLASPVGSLGILERSGRVGRDILDLAHAAAEIAIASRADLLYLSSSEVYGRDGRHAEEVPKVVEERRGTRMEYALGKLLAEHVLLNLAAEHSFRVRVCRPFNVIGEGQCARAGFVVPTFFERALAGGELPVFGDGAQLRAFCHVEDLVAGVLAVQARGRPDVVYNVGNPAEPVSIRSLADRIVALCDSPSAVVAVDPRSLHGPRYLEAYEKIPDITRVRAETAWAPRVGLDAALRRVLHHYRSRDGIRRTA